jgi:hypothetical protein
MRTFLLVCLIGFGLGLMTFGLVTPSDPDASVGPHHPAAVVLNIERDLRMYGSAVRELVRGLIEEATSPYRQRLRHESPAQAPPQ